MKRCLICAGLIAAMLGGSFGDAAPRAEAQAVAPPVNTNNSGNPIVPVNPPALTPQQRQVIRRMMRRRRHHRHRHKIPVAPVVPATSMIPNPGMQNVMMSNPLVFSQIARRHRGHHHRHQRYQRMMAQMMMRQMMLNQLLRAQNRPNQLRAAVTAENPGQATPGKNVTAPAKRRVAAPIRQGIF
jgi:hypothetical protein